MRRGELKPPSIVPIERFPRPASGTPTPWVQTKRGLAGKLIRRLRQWRFAAPSRCTYGQGKWYPGETLPRWDLLRSTGAPMASRSGTDQHLIAEEAQKDLGQAG